MANHAVHFRSAGAGEDGTPERVAYVPHGATLSEAATQAGFDLNQPCGGQGRCGRCAVVVDPARSAVRRRSTIRLSAEDLTSGYALACQTVVEGETWVTIPEQEAIERRLVTHKAAARIELPFDYDPAHHQTVQRFFLQLDPPTLADQTDDWGRISRELARQGVESAWTTLPVLRDLGALLRAGDSNGEAANASSNGSGEFDVTAAAPWEVTAVVALDSWDRPDGPPQVLAVIPGDQTLRHLGAAIDIGTTTVTVWLVNLYNGQVVAQAADYNGQIARGEDVISRIIYSRKPEQLAELQELVVETINRLLGAACSQAGAQPEEIFKIAVAGNTTMIHLLLGIPPEPIRLAPYTPVVNHPPTMRAAEIGLITHANATVDCLPGVASYVGADISAGVLSTRMDESGEIILFIDIGTNGETVLGNADWLITCACSAGPAFEGAGVEHGMRATTGAIEEVWIHSDTCEPTYRVIGREGQKPKGICGSGLLSLLAEMFVTGVVDKRGSLNTDLPPAPSIRRRVREGAHGPEYVVAWGEETAHGRDISITQVDIDNLMRAKAAIYAGFTVLAQSVGLDLADVSRMLIGGSFGQYINVEKAVQIGLLPDLSAGGSDDGSPWERFEFMGNTAIRGAYMALLRRDVRAHLTEVARMMTYVELSADNTFYDAFTSALFLPHTDASRFPSVEASSRVSNQPAVRSQVEEGL
jgi:uncharacterized 2Fe-2S/4Fe-4S cluster protein (DUF4445 family)